MKFEKFAEDLFRWLKPQLRRHQGLKIFAQERAKFEGWLKAEFCEFLEKRGYDPEPEKLCHDRKRRIDMTCRGWAVELKTLNTPYDYPGAKSKKKPLSKNVSSLQEDIDKLKTDKVAKKFKNRAVLFIVFPLEASNGRWQNTYLPRIE
ncbi:MAG: hypothetical protein KAT85_00380, partial [candidate division Zixibacteria bacterium]|nr:hypothetical protein [candidate division Zixibacteria bacterium]